MKENDNLTIFSIGHSTNQVNRFIELLQSAHITAVADVRTSPFSRHCPHFNKAELQSELRQAGIAYVFLGKELGGRPQSKDFYTEGVADYGKMKNSASFVDGLSRLINGAKKHRIALMCSEGHPLDCHRCLLVGRELDRQKITVQHILPNGKIVNQKQIEEELLALANKAEDDLFATKDERLEKAYSERSRKVAFVEPELAKIGEKA